MVDTNNIKYRLAITANKIDTILNMINNGYDINKVCNMIDDMSGDLKTLYHNLKYDIKRDRITAGSRELKEYYKENKENGEFKF